ncbi:glycogen synthase GlgA [Bacillus sp. FSL W8-0116]|uniref:glycogen synthase GlgA n=1 Tax=Bacillus sp. FSL W8-0116 TaxID=2978206 RepID=UPI0030F6C01D
MKILFVVSECVPFIKSGGLADVAGSLPKELKRFGNDVRVILPKYGNIDGRWKSQMTKEAELTVSVGWRNQYCGVERLEYDGVIYYFIDNEYYFKREGLYGYFDDGERFSFFTRAVLDSLASLNFYPEILHCHDWHAGMIPFMLRMEHQHRHGYELIRTVMTIHNLQFQGIFPKTVLTDLLGLKEEHYHPSLTEFFGNINFLKAGLVSADWITTVSPTYRDEILTPYFGEKLHGVLNSRKEQITGILNGIDESIYDPRHDPYIEPYSEEDLSGKKENKKRLQEQLHLNVEEHIPVIAIISRLTKQKGLDLVKCVFHEIMQENVQLIVLGTGEAEFERFFAETENLYPKKVKAILEFNEEMAHRIYAGADLFLMPSKFEPCGLGQMIAMKYGTLPIVRETGGLNDTVQSYNEITKEGNGFSFRNFNAHDMLYTIRRALSFYRQPDIRYEMVRQALAADNSWSHSAYQYNEMYADLLAGRESHVFY